MFDHTILTVPFFRALFKSKLCWVQSHRLVQLGVPQHPGGRGRLGGAGVAVLKEAQCWPSLRTARPSENCQGAGEQLAMDVAMLQPCLVWVSGFSPTPDSSFPKNCLGNYKEPHFRSSSSRYCFAPLAGERTAICNFRWKISVFLLCKTIGF